MITQDRLKELFDLQGEQFIRKVRLSPNAVVGQIAGTLCHAGYYRIRIDGKYYQTHRLIYLWHFGTMPDTIDHINRIRTDNRLENLRAASPQQNSFNQGIRRINTTGYKGVNFMEASGKYRAYISLDGKQIYLGLFISKLDAAKAYNDAAIKYHGEFAYLNGVSDEKKEMAN